jgi:hypothetical protein
MAHLDKYLSGGEESYLHSSEYIEVNNDTFYDLLANQGGAEHPVITKLYENDTYNYLSTIMPVMVDGTKEKAIFDIVVQKADMNIKDMEPFAKAHSDHADRIMNFTKSKIPYTSILLPEENAGVPRGEAFKVMTSKEYAGSYAKKLGELGAHIYMVKAGTLTVGAANFLERSAPKHKAADLKEALTFGVENAMHRIRILKKEQ